MPGREKLAEFASWCQKNITGDEKGQAQIFLDRLFQAFGQPGCLDVGGATGIGSAAPCHGVGAATNFAARVVGTGNRLALKRWEALTHEGQLQVSDMVRSSKAVPD